MKKLLTILTLIALTSTLAATAAESRLQNYVDKKLAPITTKEKELNSKAEAQRKANEAKKAEYKKQQAARQAQAEKQKKEIEAQKKTNESIAMTIDELASLTKIQQVAEQQGLSYNNDNIKNVTED